MADKPAFSGEAGVTTGAGSGSAGAAGMNIEGLDNDS